MKVRIAVAAIALLTGCSWNGQGDVTIYERSARARIDNLASAHDCRRLAAELARAERDGRYLSPEGPPNSDLATYMKNTIAATDCT